MGSLTSSPCQTPSDLAGSAHTLGGTPGGSKGPRVILAGLCRGLGRRSQFLGSFVPVLEVLPSCHQGRLSRMGWDVQG